VSAFARQLIEFYAFRWRIERFHFVLKSGCRFERLQLDDFLTLRRALSVYSVVAWRLMYLMYLAREIPDSRVDEAFSEVETQVLALATGKPIQSLRDALLAVAHVGGFRSTPSAREPGLQSLWLGYRQLEAMVTGFLLARNHPPP